MSCSHAASCPLFPRLQASLEGWRRTYCDHDTAWQGCARYELSLSGGSVPITLLPNGHNIQVVEPSATSAAMATATAVDELPTKVSGSWWRRLFSGGRK